MSFKIALGELQQIITPKDFYLENDIAHREALGIGTDSRKLKKGEIFIALVGKNFDGHDFVKQAIEKEAIAIVISEKPSVKIPEHIPQFVVKDTLKAYQKIARWWRDRFDFPIIAITGSVGKTTTKELIAGVLETTGKVLKTEANYNNEIGVPKTLLNLDLGHNYGAIEMAMRASGEIALLTRIARPTIGVITNVGTAHIGRLGSREAIARAKCELLAEMDRSSLAILNHDDRLLMTVAAEVWQGKTITYGLEGGDLTGQLIDRDTLRVEGLDLPLPLKGRHNAYNYLAAIAVAKAVGIDLKKLETGISIALPEGRSQRYHLPEDIIILDETYNAGLESTIASLKLLEETPGLRRIAVLGTMKELGSESALLHRQVGETVKKLEIDLLLVLVDEAATQEIAVGVQGAIATELFEDRQEILKRLKQIVKSGDRILFKASNSVGLNQVVEQFRSQF
ncbi:MAG: UDP-N-acetylmuramoyl-tripeptide--D-alanyl-D-alanine ligase [Prochloraceae cyanobacterium]|nr:UDP-N-acetylmuramoyl-tripeptide--D-alanyl-D-alanine ligase [Prochloraceae cyanobacterium]